MLCHPLSIHDSLPISASRSSPIGPASTPSAWRIIACRRRNSGSTFTLSGRPMTMPTLEPVTFGERPLRIEDVLALANRQAQTRLQDDPAFRQRIAKGAQFLDSLLTKIGRAHV